MMASSAASCGIILKIWFHGRKGSRYRPLVIRVSHVRCQAFNTSFAVCLDLTVAQKCKSVLVSVPDVVVLKSGILDRLQEMNSLPEGVSSGLEVEKI